MANNLRHLALRSALLCLFVQGACAQNIEHQIVASQFGSYLVGDEGTGFTFAPDHCQISGGGRQFPAFSTGVPVKVIDPDPALTEVSTSVTAFVTGSYCSVSLGGLTHTHLATFALTSGTGGLQEAINNGQVIGGNNTVILDALWYEQVQPRSASTVIASVQGTSALGLEDVTTVPTTWYQWNGTQYVAITVGTGSDGISGTLTPTHLPVSNGAHSLGDSAATDNGNVLTYPNSGGVLTPQYTFGTTASGNYGLLSLTEPSGTVAVTGCSGACANLALYSSTSGLGTTLDPTGLYTPHVQVSGTTITGNFVASGTSTMGLLQNGVPGSAIQVNQNGGGALAMQVNAGLGIAGPIQLSNGYGTAGQLATSAGPGSNAYWSSAGGATFPGTNGIVVATSSSTSRTAVSSDVTALLAGAAITPSMVNAVVKATGVNGAGIGVAQSAWSGAVNYPQCTAVSNGGSNWLAVAANNGVTPGTNSAIWWQVPNANTPTSGDCAFYLAASQVSGLYGAELDLPPGNTQSCIGWMEPTVTTPGNPNVVIRGAGKQASRVTQTCSISTAVITQPDSGVAYALAGIDWEGFTVEANFLAPAAMNVYGAQQFKIAHVRLRDPADGSDHYIEFGHPSSGNHTEAWTYEADLEDIDTENSHGPGRGANITASVSGGVPTFTVVAGGSSYNATYSQLILSGTGANADVPCTSRGTDTITVSGGAITGITTTATGCASPLYASVFGGNQVTYCFKFNDSSDSKSILALTPSECNTGVYASNITSQMSFTKVHPISTMIGIQDLGNNSYYSPQLDTIYRYGIDFEGATNVDNIYDAKFEWSTSLLPGSSDYHFGTVTSSPTSAPYSINIYGDSCGNSATFSGYNHFLPSSGTGLPSFAHAYNSQACDNTTRTTFNLTQYQGQFSQSNPGTFGASNYSSYLNSIVTGGTGAAGSCANLAWYQSITAAIFGCISAPSTYSGTRNIVGGMFTAYTQDNTNGGNYGEAVGVIAQGIGLASGYTSYGINVSSGDGNSSCCSGGNNVPVGQENDLSLNYLPSAYLSGVAYRATLAYTNGHTGTYPFDAYQVNTNQAGAYWRDALVTYVGALGPSSTVFNINAQGDATSSSGNYNCPNFANIYETYWTGSAEAHDQWNLYCTINSGTTPNDYFRVNNQGGATGASHYFDLMSGIILELDGATSGSTYLSASATGGKLNLGSTNATADSSGNVVAASVSTGTTPPTACGTATGCVALGEGSTAGTPTATQDYIRADSATHALLYSANGGAEQPLQWSSAPGAASTPGVEITGAPYTGGTATTNFPQLYLNQGAAVTTLSTAGTEFGINAPSGFTGHLINLFVNGGSTRFRVDYQGNVFAASGGTFPTIIHGGSTFTASGCGTVTSLTGGATGGSFLAQATSCTPVITTGLTAPHGYICDAHDVTNPGDAVNESAYTTTTVTFTGTVSVGDQILFKCDQF